MRDGLLRHLFCGVTCAALVSGPASALESDQFTLPPSALAEFGGETSWIIWEHLKPIVEQTNAAIRDNRFKAEISTTQPGRRYRLREIEKMSTETYLAHQLYRAIGRGFPKVRIEGLAQDAAQVHPQQPAIYYTRYSESIYSGTALARPLNLVAVQPTVLLHGVYCGTDKLGHMLQQGYEYYEDFMDELEDGRAPGECYAEAVDGGVGQENGIYGRIPSGTYSNADLASNYAGLKFYLNLARPVRIGDRIEPPLLIYDDEHGWVFNEDAWYRWGGGLIEPFVSEHFSEAKNPPHYDWTMRGGIRDSVAERGAAWVAFHHTNHVQEARRLQSMATWFGEPYGHSGWDDVITIVNAYFMTLEDEPVLLSEMPEPDASPSLAQRDDEAEPPSPRGGADAALHHRAVKNKAE